MKTFILNLTVAAALLLSATGCQKSEPQDIPVNATVKIEKIPNTSVSECSVRITPSEDAASFSYAIGKEDEIYSFEEGILDNIITVEGNDPVEVTFTELDSKTVYTVFARAYDEHGKSGSTYMYRVMTADASFNIETYYVTNQSAGFNILLTGDYADCEYHLGTPDEKDDFLNGKIETKRLGDISVQDNSYTLNYFNLESETDYVLYAKGYDRAGNIEYRELTVTTRPELGYPLAYMEIEHIDIYKGSFKLTSTEQTGRMIILISDLGANDAIISNPMQWGGDIIYMMQSWADSGMPNVVSSTERETTIQIENPQLTLDHQMEMYVVTCDKDMNPTGLQYFTFSTPSFNPNAKNGSVTIEISDITDKGATYTYTADENLFAFMYETIDADWYDNIKESSEWFETYLSEYLFLMGRYLAYLPDIKDRKVVHTESAGEASHRYYAAACPMNENGPRGEGWLPVVIEEYTTLSGQSPLTK